MSNPNGSEKILSAQGLSKDYELPSGTLEVLKKINFTLRPGEMHCVIGRSGSGKSTFLNLLGGLDQPTQGEIYFEGMDLARMSDAKRSKIRNRRIGFIFQFYHLLPELTLYENVILPSRISGKREDKWAKELLRRFRLLSRQHHYPSELSGGEQQRAAIARALVNHPSVVLCDEPTGNLDQETAESVTQLLFDLNREEGQSFIIVTHDETLAWRSQSVFRLVDGMLVPQTRGDGKVPKIQSF